MEQVTLKKLTGKQRRRLRALGHHLHPVVQVGKEGVTEALLTLVDRELAAHELIKLKVLETAPQDQQQTAEDIAAGVGAHLAQVLGKTALLYRPRPIDPIIDLSAP